jgi:ATPase family protein associated with various cellular activities (AAA)
MLGRWLSHGQLNFSRTYAMSKRSSKTRAVKRKQIRGQRATKGAVFVVRVRDASAKRIRQLTKQWTENTVELGLEFKKVRDTFPVAGQDHDVGAPTSSASDHTKRPGWHDWIKKNTAWSHQQVSGFIRVADKFGGRKLPANISHAVLEYLARECVSEEAREEVLNRAGKGETIGRTQAQEIARQTRVERKGATDDSDGDAGADGGEEAEAETADANKVDDTDADAGEEAEAETGDMNKTDAGQKTKAENTDKTEHRRLVFSTIGTERSPEKITKAQSKVIASKLDEIDHVLSDVSSFISQHRHAKSLEKIKSAADEKQQMSSAQLSRTRARSMMWAEKHRPTQLSECVLDHVDDESQNLLHQAVTAATLPNLLLHGPPGTGKTTIARILCDLERFVVTEFNGSLFEKGDVKKLRNIISFRTVSLEGRCVMVDEMDGATLPSQKALRALMEDRLASDVGWVFRNITIITLSWLKKRKMLTKRPYGGYMVTGISLRTMGK